MTGGLRRTLGRAALLRCPSRLLASGHFRCASRPSGLFQQPAERVAAVRLHPVARLCRDQRRRHHLAVMAERLQVSIKPIAARTGLVAKMQIATNLADFLNKITDRIRPMGDGTPMPNFSPSTILRHGNGDRTLMDIKPHIDATLELASSPFSRLGTSPSGATLERRMSRERPPTKLRPDHGV